MTAEILNKESDDTEKKIHEPYIRRWASEKLSKEEINQVKKKLKITKRRLYILKRKKNYWNNLKFKEKKNFQSL